MQLIAERGGVEVRSLAEILCRTDRDHVGSQSMAW
jgi:hypothetical protein